jgi:hypothetical protein
MKTQITNFLWQLAATEAVYQAQTTHEVIIKLIRKRKEKRHKIQNKERKKGWLRKDKGREVPGKQESCKQRNWISFKESKELQLCAGWSSCLSVLTFTFGYTWNKFQEKENPCQNTNKVYDFLQRNSKDQKPTLSFLQSNHLLSCSGDDETMM